MPNIVRRADPGGTMTYLVDCTQKPDRPEVNVHTHPHVVAGTIGMEYVGAVLNKVDASQLAAGLRANQQHTGAEVKAGHIWHCSLALSADEGVIGDAKWGEVARDFMQGMGFTDDTRWVAIDHGASREGNSHVHLVASVIKQNGAKVNTWQDMPRSQELCSKLEVKHGLKVLESRLAKVGAGSVPYTQAEAAETAKQGKVEPDRVNLERQVRATAAAAGTEAEFVRTVKAKGLLLRPFPKTETAKVTGYSIGIKAKRGERQDYFSGGQLARDLTLPQLRRHWADTTVGTEAAQRAWRGSVPVKAAKPKLQPKAIEVAQAELIGTQQQYQAITPEQLADLSHDLAGTLAIASQATEKTPGPLAKASRDVGAWAQPKDLHRTTTKYQQHTKSAALMFAIAMDPQSPKSEALVMRQLADMVAALYRLHLAARQVATRERSTTMSTQAADGLDDFLHDGLTMATVGGSRIAEVHARNKQHNLERGDAEIAPSEWGGMSDRQRGQVTEQAPSRAAADGLWDRNSIRDFRNQAKVDAVRKQWENRPSRATWEQQEQLKDLAARLKLPGMADAVSGISEAQAAAMLKDMEVAAEGLGPARLDQILAEPGLTNQTGLGDIKSDEDAEAFLARLERSAAQRETTGLPALSASESAHAPIMTGSKDPRMWASAGEPVSPKQNYTLKQQGFSPEEIATLKKGSASYVIGHSWVGDGEARKAFERNQAAGILAAPGSTDSPTATRSMQPPTDIRNRQKPPTQRQ